VLLDVPPEEPHPSQTGLVIGGTCALLLSACGDSGSHRSSALGSATTTRRVQRLPATALTSQDGVGEAARRGALLPLPPGPSHLRTPWVGEVGRHRQGRRDPRVAPPGGGPSSPSRPSALHLVGPGTGRPARRSHPTRAVDGIRRHAEDDPRLTLASRGATLDLCPPATWATITWTRDRRVDRAPRPGKSPVGLVRAENVIHRV